ncbi:hypothetical protein CC78DRAFT_221049 [Lojkania enalia]|uniref:Uncharacterized protein n=1 Tax=Lojkania enalia TaxID=147567 RepID=A0A9P4N3V1_9PLEO|nr:hypothetical protein CC78DRAFT_221049 [Didymosphaeria enalia]
MGPSKKASDSDRDGSLNRKGIGVVCSNYGGMATQSTKFPYPTPSKILSADKAVNYVQSYAGASLVRDNVDKRLVAELASWGK